MIFPENRLTFIKEKAVTGKRRFFAGTIIPL